jgi:phosphatidylserine/phosphatidylglycerophosphate/cardiolipin synthase-like enzyme
MKRMRYLGVILAVAFWVAVAEAETRVYFSPPMPGEQRVAEYILSAINGAQKEILVQQYQLTETRIILAMCEVKQRDVAVVAILDKSNHSPNKAGRGARMLRAAGVPVHFDPVSIAHNKVLIIDGCMVIGGSFNLTQNANN